jgi:RecB family exonuclease
MSTTSKRLAHTPTSVEVFKKCPREYKAKYINKDLPYFQSPEAARGDEIHKALEAYLVRRGEYELPEYARGAKATLDYLLANYEVSAEAKFRVNEQLDPCEWTDKEAWFGGIADVVLKPKNNPDHILVLDWKTGKPQTEADERKYGNKHEVQSEILAIAAGKKYNATTVTTLFIFLDHAVAKTYTYTFKDNQTTLLAHAPLFNTIRRMEKAVVDNKFPPTKNGLCEKYCGLTKCQYNGRFEGGDDYE